MSILHFLHPYLSHPFPQIFVSHHFERPKVFPSNQVPWAALWVHLDGALLAHLFVVNVWNAVGPHTTWMKPFRCGFPLVFRLVGSWIVRKGAKTKVVCLFCIVYLELTKIQTLNVTLKSLWFSWAVCQSWVRFCVRTTYVGSNILQWRWQDWWGLDWQLQGLISDPT